MRIEQARELIGVATVFLKDTTNVANDIRLEQIEPRGDHEFLVVLSYPDPAAAPI